MIVKPETYKPLLDKLKDKGFVKIVVKLAGDRIYYYLRHKDISDVDAIFVSIPIKDIGKDLEVLKDRCRFYIPLHPGTKGLAYRDVIYIVDMVLEYVNNRLANIDELEILIYATDKVSTQESIVINGKEYKAEHLLIDKYNNIKVALREVKSNTVHRVPIETLEKNKKEEEDNNVE